VFLTTILQRFININKKFYKNPGRDIGGCYHYFPEEELRHTFFEVSIIFGVPISRCPRPDILRI